MPQLHCPLRRKLISISVGHGRADYLVEPVARRLSQVLQFTCIASQLLLFLKVSTTVEKPIEQTVSSGRWNMLHVLGEWSLCFSTTGRLIHQILEELPREARTALQRMVTGSHLAGRAECERQGRLGKTTNDQSLGLVSPGSWLLIQGWNKNLCIFESIKEFYSKSKQCYRLGRNSVNTGTSEIVQGHQLFLHRIREKEEFGF